jgi:hypothetical protein
MWIRTILCTRAALGCRGLHKKKGPEPRPGRARTAGERMPISSGIMRPYQGPERRRA